MTSSTVHLDASTHGPQVLLEQGAPRPVPAWPRVLRLLSLIVVLICVILLMRLLPMDRIVRLLTTAIEGLGVWGPIVFALIYVAAALLFVPGSALTLASGLLFGLAGGTAVVGVAGASV